MWILSLKNAILVIGHFHCLMVIFVLDHLQELKVGSGGSERDGRKQSKMHT